MKCVDMLQEQSITKTEGSGLKNSNGLHAGIHYTWPVLSLIYSFSVGNRFGSYIISERTLVASLVSVGALEPSGTTQARAVSLLQAVLDCPEAR